MSYNTKKAFYGQDDQKAPGSVSCASATFVDTTGWPSYTFVAAEARVYLVHVDLTCWLGSATTDRIDFVLVKDGVQQPALAAATTYLNTQSRRVGISFRQAVTMAVGNNVLKLYWKHPGTGTININTDDARCYTVTD